MFEAGWIFRTKCDFLQVLDLLIFRQKQPGHWAEVICHFHLTLSVILSSYYCENGRRRWASIAPSLLPENVLPSRNNQAIGAEVICHFHPTFNVVALLKISQNII